MLRLRKVELFGFKSFADRTSILFPGNGVSAIVGPNGCGKSNIADAVLWVLGEQSAKTLRSSRMADCIFNGTTDRPPTNLAEVSLTLLDPKAAEAGSAAELPLFSVEQSSPSVTETPAEDSSELEAAAAETQVKPREKAERNRLGFKLEPGEAVITRRLYRDGKSEYFLNGNTCRLRDIQEIFLGTGLGPQSYAIIEQGRVGQILSSRPSDRRTLLEEAAGITKYKTKRRLAEGKLEAARQNLLRINDILEEVTKQLGSLKRQASRARRYQQLKSESVALRRLLLATQFDLLNGRDRDLDSQIQSKVQEIQILNSDLAGLEQRQSADQQRQFELETLVRQEQNRVGEMLVALERTQAGLAECLRRQQDLQERLAQIDSDKQKEAEEAARNAEQFAQTRKRAAELDTALERLGSETRETEELARTAREQARQLEANLAELDTGRTEILHRLAAVRAEIGQLEQTAEELSSKITRLRSEGAQREREKERLLNELSTARKQYEHIRDSVASAQEEAGTAEQALSRAEQEHDAQKQLLEKMRDRLAAATAQEQALNDLVQRRTAFAEAVRNLLLHGQDTGEAERSAGTSEQPANGNGFRAVGVLADFAEFEPDYAEVLQNYLKEELEYVVVDTYDTARHGVSLLREQTGGRATFLVDSFHRTPAPTPAVALPQPRGNGLIGPVADFLRINGPLGNEAKKVLPRLANTYLVQSAYAAEGLATDYPHHSFLATDGTCYQGRLVTGGKTQAHGAFVLQRDIDHAVRRRAEIEPKTTELAAVVARSAARLVELETQRNLTRRNLQQREKDLVECEKSLLAASTQSAHLEDVMQELAAEHARTETQLRATLNRLAAAREETETSGQRLVQRDAERREKTEALQQARQGGEDLWTRQTDFSIRLAALEERRAATHSESSRLTALEETESARRRALLTLEEQLSRQQKECQAEESTLRQEIEQRRRQRDAQEELCHRYDSERDALRARLSNHEASLRRMRATLEEARESRNTLEVERARLQSDQRHLEDSVQGEFGLTGAQLSAQATERLEGPELAEAEDRDRELRRKLDNIGPVNMMALEEFQETEQRHVFLTSQREDLLASIEDITRTIDELDVIAHKRFSEAFTTINQNFQETFKTLFNGGQATLRLTEADDPSDAGVELICQPPGKRLQNVLLLSGGEKALTALSLLIAIFRYAPSPFCILDEVDAPLDDTNIGRFTRLLEEMAPQTQFILVTHSKKTMEAASILYGVTMQNAVSQVVSVRFDEAPETAA